MFTIEIEKGIYFKRYTKKNIPEMCVDISYAKKYKYRHLARKHMQRLKDEYGYKELKIIKKNEHY